MEQAQNYLITKFIKCNKGKYEYGMGLLMKEGWSANHSESSYLAPVCVCRKFVVRKIK
jgi:hypothetical protein